MANPSTFWGRDRLFFATKCCCVVCIIAGRPQRRQAATNRTKRLIRSCKNSCGSVVHAESLVAGRGRFHEASFDAQMTDSKDTLLSMSTILDTEWLATAVSFDRESRSAFVAYFSSKGDITLLRSLVG